MSLPEIEEWRLYYFLTGNGPDSVERTLARLGVSMHGMILGKKSRLEDAHLWPYLKAAIAPPITSMERTEEEQEQIVAKITANLQFLAGRG